jgi:hypothetical protein
MRGFGGSNGLPDGYGYGYGYGHGGGYGRMGGFAHGGFFPFGGLLAGLFMLAVAVLVVVAFWRILHKAGYPGALALLLLVPVVNVVLVLFLAFADWPVHKSLLQWKALAQAGPAPAPETYVAVPSAPAEAAPEAPAPAAPAEAAVAESIVVPAEPVTKAKKPKKDKK